MRTPLLPGDVVLTSEAPLGEVAFVRKRLEWCLGQRLFALRPKPELDGRFLYYALQSASVREDLLARATGTTAQGIRQSELRKVGVPMPPLAEQGRIATVLGCLDEKIELNRRMSQTLEAIAQAIFRSWFVDFDPVQAKAGGEAAADIQDRLGLNPATQALFPAQLSAQGPEGWRPATLKDFTIKIGSGATPRGGSEVYVEKGMALIRSQNVYDSKFVWDGLARITDDAARLLANVAVQAGDVLLNITGASILRTCVVPPSVLPARVNQHVAIVRARPGVPTHFLHQHLLLADTKAYLLGLNAGASREAVTKAHIESVCLLDPGPALLAAFEAAVAPLFAQAQACASEALVLAGLRDTLLPKLLSGELSTGGTVSHRSAMIA